jgi:hypothetical protein
MSLVKRVFQRVRRDYFRWQYQKVAREILDTTPLRRGDIPFVLLSMVQQRDVYSYLVAVKSFTHFLNPQRIVVVCDPSLDESDRKILTRHIPHIELREAQEFTHRDIPRGGTWERLFAISEFAKENYVVQLDADTLTVQPVDEVRAAIEQGCGFVLGEMPDTPVRQLPAVRENALPWIKPGAHIQSICESEMVNVGLPEDARYIRGCSGFTGFPRSADMRETMLDFSRRMGAHLGKDWERWGTEQVTSNYIVSNASGTKPLPFPKYGTPDCLNEQTAFLHFIGPMRFINNKYKRTSRHVIHLLSSSAA